MFRVIYISLEETLVKTENIKWSEVENKQYQYIDLSSVDRNSNSITETTQIDRIDHPSRAQQLVRTDDILFGTTRPTLQRYARIGKNFDGQIASTGFSVLRPDKTKILSKFLYYSITATYFLDYVELNQKGASYPAISDNQVKKYHLGIPSLAEQRRIVDILDKFEKLSNDLLNGLPKEIELRQKQYEYWREQLLRFTKLEK